MITQPMLAVQDSLTDEQLEQLDYPVGCTEKLDGIRCEGKDTPNGCVALSRKLIEIPNMWIQNWFSVHNMHGLDGEIVIPGLGFHDIQSFCMSEYSTPKPWEFRVFDSWALKGGYQDRVLQLMQNEIFSPRISRGRVHLLEPVICKNPREVRYFFKKAINVLKVEGIIIRSLDGPYKQGRSTLNEGYMMKLKEYERSRAVIIGWEPRRMNLNPKTYDNTGKAKRSSHKANRIPVAMVGKLIVRDVESDIEFRIGTGLTAAVARQMHNNFKDWRGGTVYYKHQPHGRKDKPRCPSIEKLFDRNGKPAGSLD